MSFPYGRYKNSRDASWRCLLDNQVSALPVSVSEIARRSQIRLASYSKNAAQVEQSGLGHLLENDGFSSLTSTGPVILYRDGLDPRVSRFTIAHELGHIFLGHLFPLVNGTRCTVRNRGPARTDDPLEHEANVFASRLLAPACVLWGIGVHSADEISALCDISLPAARVRAERLALLYQRERDWLATRGRSCFLTSPLEQEVFRHFSEYIQTRKPK